MPSRADVEEFLSKAQEYRARKDVEAMLSLLDDRATFRIVGAAAEWPFGAPLVGQDAIRPVLQHLVENFEFLEHRPISVHIDGEHVVARYHVTLRHAGSARVVETELADFMTFANGKCVSYAQFADTALAMELSRG